jgi:hypothetical protein
MNQENEIKNLEASALPEEEFGPQKQETNQ